MDRLPRRCLSPPAMKSQDWLNLWLVDTMCPDLGWGSPEGCLGWPLKGIPTHWNNMQNCFHDTYVYCFIVLFYKVYNYWLTPNYKRTTNSHLFSKRWQEIPWVQNSWITQVSDVLKCTCLKVMRSEEFISPTYLLWWGNGHVCQGFTV